MGKKWIMRTRVLGMVLAGLLLTGLWGVAQAKEAANPVELLEDASTTLKHFLGDKQMGWLHQNLKKAKAVLIVPSLVKVGFFLGGAGGNAVLFARDETSGEWSQPVFYNLGHVSFGLQFGGEEQEVLMLIQTQKALRGLYKLDFKLGGDTSMAAGPIGGGVSGTVKADIISFAYSKGIFAGAAFEGAVMQPNKELSQAFYKKTVSPRDILVNKKVSNPQADKLREELRTASK